MNCKQAYVFLPGLVYNELPEKQRKKLLKHIDHCNSCRSDYEKLKTYSKIVAEIPDHDTPPELKKMVMKAIKDPNRVNNKNYTPWRGKILTGLLAAASVAILIGITTIINRPVRIETAYTPAVIKRGKGPGHSMASLNDTDKRAGLLKGYADSVGAKYSVLKVNSATQKPDMVRIKFDLSQYNAFTKLFNSENIREKLKPLPPGTNRKKLVVIISLDEKKIFTGDFNGDGRDDFGILCYRGRNTGKLFIALKEDSLSYSQPKMSDPGIDKIEFTGSSSIIGCDINGDKLDDIIIIGKDKNDSTYLFTLINNGYPSFTKESKKSNLYTLLSGHWWCTYLSGDINGDKYDDLGIYYYRGPYRGSFIFALNKHDGTFNDPAILETGLLIPGKDTRHTPLIMDINGDGYSDPGIYWQAGERNAGWFFSPNIDGKGGKDEFTAKFGRGIKAFMGDYTALTGDVNGDGYDELLVKTGMPNDYSSWYIMYNRCDSSFSLGYFINFDGESDITLKTE